MYPHANLGADSFGPPRPGQTDAEFQKQMATADVVAGASVLATMSLVNPIAAAAVALGYIALRPKKKSRYGGGA